MDLATAILLTVVTASTPLLLAAVGELVVERSGVLNLGVEGMMIMGAACGFAATLATGSHAAGVGVAMLAGMAMAAIFGLLVLGLVANQVACGLALTILGLGLSGLVGQGMVGQRIDPVGPVDIPWLGSLPVVGKLVFGLAPFVYASVALVAGTGWFLSRTRAGRVLRAVGA
ncbi:MAG: ABC transporter permease subunit, partial [Alphaproteobacteria bacterium]